MVKLRPVAALRRRYEPIGAVRIARHHRVQQTADQVLLRRKMIGNMSDLEPRLLLDPPEGQGGVAVVNKHLEGSLEDLLDRFGRALIVSRLEDDFKPFVAAHVASLPQNIPLHDKKIMMLVIDMMFVLNLSRARQTGGHRVREL